MTPKEAEKIADALLTNGLGQKGVRLVIELPGGKDGGGWCRSAIAQQVLTAYFEHCESR